MVRVKLTLEPIWWFTDWTWSWCILFYFVLLKTALLFSLC